MVISVPWLGFNLLGELLSAQFISRARITGVYTAEDFQSVYTECDAIGVLDLMEALDLCVQVLNNSKNNNNNKHYKTFYL